MVPVAFAKMASLIQWWDDTFGWFGWLIASGIGIGVLRIAVGKLPLLKGRPARRLAASTQPSPSDPPERILKVANEYVRLLAERLPNERDEPQYQLGAMQRAGARDFVSQKDFEALFNYLSARGYPHPWRTYDLIKHQTPTAIFHEANRRGVDLSDAHETYEMLMSALPVDEGMDFDFTPLGFVSAKPSECRAVYAAIRFNYLRGMLEKDKSKNVETHFETEPKENTVGLVLIFESLIPTANEVSLTWISKDRDGLIMIDGALHRKTPHCVYLEFKKPSEAKDSWALEILVHESVAGY